MTDRTLPPLPTPGVPNTRLPLDRAWKDGSFAAVQMQSYALTALAPLEAENKALRAEVDRLKRALADVVDRDWTYLGQDADTGNPASLYSVVRRGRQALADRSGQDDFDAWRQS